MHGAGKIYFEAFVVGKAKWLGWFMGGGRESRNRIRAHYFVVLSFCLAAGGE